jgi:hypothetical protein
LRTAQELHKKAEEAPLDVVAPSQTQQNSSPTPKD